MPVDIAALRDIALGRVLIFLHADGDFVKVDSSYMSQNNQSRRYYVTTQNSSVTHELVITGSKWVDKTGRGQSGGGAIDLVMHLRGTHFSGAVSLLQRLQAQRDT